MNYSFLLQTNLFKNISEKETEKILKDINAYKKSYSKSDIIYMAGSTASDIGLVLSGSVNIVVDYYWGGSNIFAHIAPGEIFAETYALLPEKELMCSVIAAEKSEILFMNANKMLSMHNDNCLRKLTCNLLQISAQKNITMSTRMMHTASKHIRSRLLSYFSEQALISGTNQFTIPFSRRQLAEYIGVDRSSMSNELSKMKQEGLIDYEKNSFKLL